MVIPDNSDEPYVTSKRNDIDGNVGGSSGNRSVVAVQQDRNRSRGRNPLDLSRDVAIDHNVTYDDHGLALRHFRSLQILNYARTKTAVKTEGPAFGAPCR